MPVPVDICHTRAWSHVLERPKRERAERSDKPRRDRGERGDRGDRKRKDDDLILEPAPEKVKGFGSDVPAFLKR